MKENQKLQQEEIQKKIEIAKKQYNKYIKNKENKYNVIINMILKNLLKNFIIGKIG